jgi:hypothetical protein
LEIYGVHQNYIKSPEVLLVKQVLLTFQKMLSDRAAILHECMCNFFIFYVQTSENAEKKYLLRAEMNLHFYRNNLLIHFKEKMYFF